MRLVIDGQRLTAERTGVGRCLEDLLATWSSEGWPLDRVVIALRDSAGLARVPRGSGADVRLVGEGWPGLVWETFALGRILRRDDVLLAPANLIPWNWRGRSVLILYDTLTWSNPGGFPRLVRWRFGWRYKLAARRATRIVVPSRATASDVARFHGVPRERMRVVYPGPGEGFYRREPGSQEEVEARAAFGLGDAPFFLFVGKRSRRRNVPAVLDAFERLCDRFPDCRLVFVGPAGGEPARPTGANVVDGGFVDERTLVGLYAGAVALIYPSESEGFGLPVVEAQACGCPVITSRTGALLESAAEGVIALGDLSSESILRAMTTLLEDSTARDESITRGFQNARRFDSRAFALGVSEEIRRVAGLGEPRPTGSHV